MITYYDIVLKIKLEGDGLGLDDEELVGIYDLTAGDKVMPFSIQTENHVTAMGFMSLRAVNAVNHSILMSKVEETVKAVVKKWEMGEADAEFDGEVMDGFSMYLYNSYDDDDEEEKDDEDAVYRLIIYDDDIRNEAVELLDNALIRNDLVGGGRIMIFGKDGFDEASELLIRNGIEFDVV